MSTAAEAPRSWLLATRLLPPAERRQGMPRTCAMLAAEPAWEATDMLLLSMHASQHACMQTLHGHTGLRDTFVGRKVWTLQRMV